MRVYRVSAQFPEALAKAWSQQLDQKAGSPQVAVYRALRTMMGQPGIKGRRIKSISIRVTRTV